MSVADEQPEQQSVRTKPTATRLDAPNAAPASTTEPRIVAAPVEIEHRRPAVSRGAERHAVAEARSTERPHGKAAQRPHDSARKRPHARLAPSTAAETRRAAVRSRYNDPGYCLEWSREQADVPARYPDAATAWAHATGKRRGDRTPPAGAVVYWTGGSHGYGHVAISVGGGKVRSSDAGGAGRVSTVPVGWVGREWGLKYAGWSDSINGYKIPGVAGA